MKKYFLIAIVASLCAVVILVVGVRAAYEQSPSGVDATGMHCGGFIKDAPVCPSGYHCELKQIADRGGSCVKDGVKDGSTQPPEDVTVPSPPPASDGGVVCAMEAKMCPDGSYVGRTGPKCEFSACPLPAASGTSGSSGISGTASLGPTCPVERMPPDPACAYKPYQGSFYVRTESGKLVATLSTRSDGSFKLNLDPGTYIITLASTSVMPRLSPTTVIVEKGKSTTVALTLDSGIR